MRGVNAATKEVHPMGEDFATLILEYGGPQISMTRRWVLALSNGKVVADCGPISACAVEKSGLR
jgi:hypothetical protein